MLRKHLTSRFAVLYFICIGVITLLVACHSQPAGGDAAAVTLLADGASYPLAEALLNAYETRNPSVAVSLRPVERSAVTASLNRGEANAALFFHPLTDSGLFSVPVARDAVAIIVHPDNPVSGLTLVEVQAVFSGRLARWDEASGEALPIEIVMPGAWDSVRVAFSELAPGGLDVSSTAELGISDTSRLDRVMRSSGAISMVPASRVTRTVRVLSIDGKEPFGSGGYPLETTIVLMSVEEPQGRLRDLLEWVLSTEGQAVVVRFAEGL